MTFERLEALYRGHGSVHYKGELYEIVDVNTPNANSTDS